MKVLFVENRYKTFFWEEIARHLEKEDHVDVHWIVQNHGYIPKIGRVHTIPYPARRKTYPVDSGFDAVLRMDRQRTYYGYSNWHYGYYSREIQSILDEVDPDIVFGEVSLFHEFMACQLCKSRGLTYLQPTSCRYPVGRFAFYQYDTLRPYSGSGEIIATADARDIVRAISNRTVQLDYMKPAGTRPVVRAISKLGDRIRTTRNYLAGERFNTPSPLTKLLKDRRAKRNRAAWEALAREKYGREREGLRLLYPMQLQPENTLDVLANEFRDQTKLVRDLSTKLRDGDWLYVKPNPKSNYELNAELLDLLRSNERIVPIPHSLPMGKALQFVDLVVTVNGTVAIEAIMSDVPVVTLSDYLDILSNHKIGATSVDGVLQVLEQVRNGAHKSFSIAEKEHLIRRLVGISHRGVISDPFVDPHCLAPENIRRVTEAFRSVLNCRAATPKFAAEPA